MAGSWELRAQNQVLCAFLHTETTSIAWSLGFRNLIIPGQILPISGCPFDHGRNTACKAALEGGFEYLFFLDSDVIPPRDAILRLLAHKLPVVSGLYCRRSPPHSVPVAIRNGTWYTNMPMNRGLVEVDLVGAGCLLIHRSALERIPPQRPEAGKHWFDWRVDCQHIATQDKPPLSEDFTLCHHWRQHGIKIMIDPTVHCKHVGLAQSTYGQLLPCEVNVNT